MHIMTHYIVGLVGLCAGSGGRWYQERVRKLKAFFPHVSQAYSKLYFVYCLGNLRKYMAMGASRERS